MPKPRAYIDERVRTVLIETQEALDRIHYVMKLMRQLGDRDGYEDFAEPIRLLHRARGRLIDRSDFNTDRPF